MKMKLYSEKVVGNEIMRSFEVKKNESANYNTRQEASKQTPNTRTDIEEDSLLELNYPTHFILN